MKVWNYDSAPARLCLVLFLEGALLGSAGCSPTSQRAEAFQVSLESIDAEIKAQAPLVADGWQRARELSMAPPAQHAALRETLSSLNEAFELERDALDGPVQAAEGELKAAQVDLQVALSAVRRHSTNTRGRRQWCGSDGCDGDCAAQCDEDDICHDNQCRCVPDCEGKACGGDGCGGFCGETGSCAGGQYCTELGACEAVPVEQIACTPSCANSGSPARAAGVKSLKVRDRSLRRPRNRGELMTVSGMSDWLSALEAREAKLQASTREIAADRDALSRLEAEFSSLEAREASTKEAYDAARVKARESKLEEDAAAQDTAKEAYDAVRASIKEKRATIKEARRALEQKRKALKSSLEQAPRVAAEVRRVKAALKEARAREARLDAAQSKLAAAEAARASARVALVERFQARRAEALSLLQDVNTAVISHHDEAWARCDDKICAFASLLRAETCSDESPLDACPDDPRVSKLLERIEQAAEARVQSLKEARAGDFLAQLKHFEEKLTLAREAALILNMTQGGDPSLTIVADVARERDVHGVPNPARVKELRDLVGPDEEPSEAQGPPSNDPRAHLRALVSAAEALPQFDTYHREINDLRQLAVRIRRTRELYALRVSLKSRFDDYRANL